MAAGKTRITMMVDADVVAFFKARAARRGAEPYQTQINRLLRHYAAGVDAALGAEPGHVAEPVARYRSSARVRAARRRGKQSATRSRRALQHTIKVVVRPGDEFGWVAECIELPVVTQGMTLDEIALNLREAVALHLADEEPEALGLTSDPTILVTLELPSAHA
jgi:predicted RNase H-like HicB family nuclease